jgi:hypothetical protein
MLEALFSCAALGVLLAVTLVVAIWRAFFTRLASVPGPFVARFTDLWYAYRIYRGGFEKDNLQLHEKYGTFVLTWLIDGQGSPV